MDIGGKVKKIRIQRNLTQQQLAAEVGVNRSFIAQIERNSKVLSLPLGKEIAKVLGCTVNDLVK